MKPNMLNVTAVSTTNVTIQIGCTIWYGTNTRIDLVAAAPT